MSQRTFEIMVDVNTKEANRQLAQVNRNLEGLQKSLKQSSRQAKSTQSSMSGLGKSFAGLAAAIGVTGLAKQVIAINSKFEDLKTSLNVVTGSAKNGADAFERIGNIATSTPFGIDALSESFIKLKSSGIEPTDDLLMMFSDTASVTTDKLGSLQAMTDLYARTTSGGLGLEELNRLADRGIPVFNILQERLGVTRLQLSNLGKTAEGSALIIKELEVGLKDAFGGASEKAAENLSVKISNLGIAFEGIALQFGEGGFTNIVKDALSIITDIVIGLKDEAQYLGAAFQFAFEAIKGVALDAFTTLSTGFNELDGDMDQALSKGLTLESVFSGIAFAFTGFVNSFKIGFKTLSILLTDIGKRLGALAGFIVDNFQGALGNVKQLFLNLGNGIIEFFNRIGQQVSSFGLAVSNALTAAINFEDPAAAFEKSFSNIDITGAFDLSKGLTELKGGFAEANKAINNETKASLLDLSKFIEENVNLGDVFSDKGRDRVLKFLEETQSNINQLVVENTTVTDDNNKSKEKTAVSTENIAKAQELLTTSTKATTEAQKEQAQVQKQINSSFESLGEAVGRFATGTKEAIRGIIAELIRLAALQIFGGTGPFMGGFLSGFGQISGYADGGRFNAGETFMVGERGPELITASAPGMVIPNHQLGAKSAGFSQNISLSINGSIVASEELDRKFEEFAGAIADNTQSLLRNQLRTGGVLA